MAALVPLSPPGDGNKGNAGGEPPHLHFEVGQVAEPPRWWRYEPLTPYEFLTHGPIR